MSDVGAMTKTAEERAREIVQEWLRVRLELPADSEEIRAHITSVLREVQRAVWLSAAEVAENPTRAGREWVPGSLWDTLAKELGAALRRRAEEV